MNYKQNLSDAVQVLFCFGQRMGLFIFQKACLSEI